MEHSPDELMYMFFRELEDEQINNFKVFFDGKIGGYIERGKSESTALEMVADQMRAFLGNELTIRETKQELGK